MRISLTLAAFVLALGTANPVLAQDGEPAAPLVDEIYLENTAPQPLTFGLSNDNETRDRFGLGAGQVGVFGGSEVWYFLLLTDGVELRYRLDAQGSYRLHWNEIDLRWDLLTCEQPACGRALDEEAEEE
jgi:hypothetical protein